MAGAEERFARFELIQWWEQVRLAEARIVVVGAGALGNEIVKNAALLGVGEMVILDFDRIEASNLSRSVLFRAEDTGAPKASTAARRAMEIYPALRATALDANVVHEVGNGLFRWASLIIGAVDNREARLAINRHAYRVGTPWIDGAIEALSGIARAFQPPEGPCYECTMGEADWRVLEARRSCSLLNRELAVEGKVPTTPTTASVIAAIQCQEALKLLHGRTTLVGRGFVFDGSEYNSYLVSYQRNPECLSHATLASIVSTDARADGLTGKDALALARDVLGEQAQIEFVRELLLALDCLECGRSEPSLRPLLAVSESAALCPACGSRRAPRLYHSLAGDEDFLHLSLAELGVPPWDIIVARTRDRRVGLELNGDRADVLGHAARGGAP